MQRGAFWCQLSMGRQSAVSIFIFSCPALCLIKSEWLRCFPLGFFPSPASLCDLIRRMNHTVRSLEFHRKHGHVVPCTPTAPGERPHIGERCACTRALRFVLCLLRRTLYADMREMSQSKGSSSLLLRFHYSPTVFMVTVPSATIRGVCD